MELNLNYVHNEAIGYGRLGVKLAEALTAKGVEVYDHMPTPPGVYFSVDQAAGRRAGTAGSICWISVPTHAQGWWSTQHASIFTMWEADRLPEDFRSRIHHFDTLLVPSEQNVELFGEYHPNVRLAYLGVDPAEWHYVKRQEPSTFFTFLCGGSGARKGTDITYRAFAAAFPTADGSGPIPRLVMKNPRGEDFPSMNGRVEVIGGRLDLADEIALYETAHCYVQPSRGEGFGLQPLQALAQGCPTILTDAHGHASFAHLGEGISAVKARSAYFIYGDAGNWWEPDFDETVDLMRWVYDHYDHACQKAAGAAKVIAQDFTWANTADAFIGHLELDRPFVGGGEWFLPHELRFRIRVRRTIDLEVAGRRLRFEAGQDYWDLADVKRILCEAGELDPHCYEMADEDPGLTPEQMARLGHISGDDPRGDPVLTGWHAGA